MANYYTVKNGIVGLLNTLGFYESSEATDFKHAPVNEYGNRFILKPLSGENQNDTIIDRFDDTQEWQLLIAFVRTENNDISNIDSLHIAKDRILKYIDNPTNWTSFVKMLRYEKWTVEELANYYVLDIRIHVIDQYIHT
jgi:hypothetical protein